MYSRICRILAIASVAVASSAGAAAAGDLKVVIGNGRATVVAKDVPLRQILAEWARLGRTTITNGDKLNGPAMTLELVDRPEREVLDVLLKSASGYIAAQRPVAIASASVFDRVMILPSSHGPVGTTAAPPAAFGRMGQPPMQMPPPVDDDEPMDPSVPMNQPMVNQPPPPYPVAAPQQPGQQPAVMTAPRPGMLPAAPAGQGEVPFGGQPPNPRLPPGAPGNPDR